MKLKDFGRFLIIVLLFFAVTSPIVVLFGPFDNIKRTVVGAILKSRHPPVHYLALQPGRNRPDFRGHQYGAKAGTL